MQNRRHQVNRLQESIDAIQIELRDQNPPAQRFTSRLRDILPPPTFGSPPRLRLNASSSNAIVERDLRFSLSDNRSPTPPLSPIALEGLQDSVAYAREITTQSMEEFYRRHIGSLTELQSSFEKAKQSAKDLLQMFQRVETELRMLE
uniref:Uncharacterized protein n=1 Tax=Romanomermis culicivorax TaxID=13658 RepID=A0A915KH64_ROMCU